MTAEIKNHVSACESFREYEGGQAKETIMFPKTPSRPWQRVAANLCESEGKTYLMTSDYFSDYFELDFLRSSSSVNVIRKLKAHFAHLMSSPHYSQRNRKAESAVKEAKKLLRKCNSSGSDAFLALLDHRNTPPAGVQISPAQHFLSRRTRGLPPMTASFLAPQTIPGNELCRAMLEQRKERQAYYYNKGTSDLDPLQKGDTERLKPFQLGRQEW